MSKRPNGTKDPTKASLLRVLPGDSEIVKILGYSHEIAHVKINFAESHGAVWYAYGKYSCDGLAHALRLGHRERIDGDLE